LKKIDGLIEKRNQNFKLYSKLLSPKVWFPKEIEDTFTANFAIPVITKNKESKSSLIKELMDNGIACRPLISGSMGSQPFYKKIYGELILPNCSIIDERGIYVPNHPQLEESDIELICDIILKHA
jgi:CDP-6-deoxy-D-xylo-4-hexulose-3-dehydrase